MLYGYDSLRNDFQKLIESGRLSHAYLFYGEPETGKFLFASEVAEMLASRSDTHIVDFENEDDRISESVGIEKIREINHFLYQKPIGLHRVVVIRDAQWLTVAAQNALLKILEEPPESGIIFATVTDPEIFLPAVRSRFQRVYMPILSTARILDFLNRYDIIENIRIETAENAHGRVGRAIRLIEGKNGSLKKAERLAEKSLHAASGTERKKMSDEILEFFDEDRGHADMFIEELTNVLYRQKTKNAAALNAVCDFSLNLHEVTLQKRIHIKKILWMIQ